MTTDEIANALCVLAGETSEETGIPEARLAREIALRFFDAETAVEKWLYTTRRARQAMSAGDISGSQDWNALSSDAKIIAADKSFRLAMELNRLMRRALHSWEPSPDERGTALETPQRIILARMAGTEGAGS